MEVQTQTLVQYGEAEDAASATITADQFTPSAPLTAAPPAYSAGATYGKGALVIENGSQWRSVRAANKAHTPHEDAAREWWVPVSIPIVLLQNPTFGQTSFVR